MQKLLLMFVNNQNDNGYHMVTTKIGAFPVVAWPKRYTPLMMCPFAL